jgi:hypothetical protein
MNTNDSQSFMDETRSRQQIEQQLHQWSRGADRIDMELMLSVFHPNANINYGIFNGPAEDFLSWVVKFHTEDLVSTSHNILNVLVRFDKERAYSESVVDCRLRYKSTQGLSDLIISGRYLDKWPSVALVGWRCVEGVFQQTAD